MSEVVEEVQEVELPPAPPRRTESVLDSVRAGSSLDTHVEYAAKLLALAKRVYEEVMTEKVHYGTIPGTSKPTLYLPGAELFLLACGLSQEAEVEDLSTPGVRRFRVKTTIRDQVTGRLIATGLGECSSEEEKYAWREAYEGEWEAALPESRREKLYRGKPKKQVAIPCADVSNTILKMSSKRSTVDGTLRATGASAWLTQDLEDMPPETYRRRGGSGIFEEIDGQVLAVKGKHGPQGDKKGQPIEMVPLSYLEWLTTKAERATESDKAFAQAEIDARKKPKADPLPGPPKAGPDTPKDSAPYASDESVSYGEAAELAKQLWASAREIGHSAQTLRDLVKEKTGKVTILGDDEGGGLTQSEMTSLLASFEARRAPMKLALDSLEWKGKDPPSDFREYVESIFETPLRDLTGEQVRDLTAKVEESISLGA